jgi:hypothetical protein
LAVVVELLEEVICCGPDISGGIDARSPGKDKPGVYVGQDRSGIAELDDVSIIPP